MLSFLSLSNMSCLASSERGGITFGLLPAGIHFLLILSRVFQKNIPPWCAFAGSGFKKVHTGASCTSNSACRVMTIGI